MDRSRIAIVMPALNEADSIGSVVEQATHYGLPIVVDDGSTDDTGKIARAAKAEVVRHERNYGYDRALESGFARAASLDCELVITMDADGQHNVDLLQHFVSELDRGAEVVIGVRNRRQRVSEHLFAWVANWLWGVSDPLCGMKGYRISVYRQLGHFDSYSSIGTELALYAARNGFRISQIPVLCRERIGTPRFGGSLLANWRILRSLILSFIRTIVPQSGGRDSIKADAESEDR